MKKKVFDLVLVLAMLMSVMILFTGCGEKYENIVVYINDGLSDSKINSIEEELKAIEDVNSIQYISKVEAYDIAKEKIGEEFLDSYTETNHPFLASFTLEVKKNKNYDKIIEEIESIDGVKTVQVEETVTVRDLVDAEMNYIKNQM